MVELLPENSIGICEHLARSITTRGGLPCNLIQYYKQIARARSRSGSVQSARFLHNFLAAGGNFLIKLLCHSPIRIASRLHRKLSVCEVYKVKMKPPRNSQGQFSRNIPELIQLLRGVYSGIESDPTLSEPAKHIRRAVVELENARKAAWEVWQEGLGALDPSDLDEAELPAQCGDERDDDDAVEWFRHVQPASPLKQ